MSEWMCQKEEKNELKKSQNHIIFSHLHVKCLSMMIDYDYVPQHTAPKKESVSDCLKKNWKLDWSEGIFLFKYFEWISSFLTESQDSTMCYTFIYQSSWHKLKTEFFFLLLLFCVLLRKFFRSTCLEYISSARTPFDLGSALLDSSKLHPYRCVFIPTLLSDATRL